MTCDEECIRSIVKEELSKLHTMQSDTQSNTPKKTKKKSAWNIFLSDCTKRQPEGTPLGDRTKACSIEYKELKNNGSLNDFISKLTTSINKSKNKDNDDK
jgi:hypothetical protein